MNAICATWQDIGNHLSVFPTTFFVGAYGRAPGSCKAVSNVVSQKNIQLYQISSLLPIILFLFDYKIRIVQSV